MTTVETPAPRPAHDPVHEGLDAKQVARPVSRAMTRVGFTLSELLVVMLLVSILTGIAATGYSGYLRRSIPDRASRVVGSYLTLTRSYAVQRRSPVTLAVDPLERRLMIRSEGDTIRTMSFGEESDLPLETLDTNIDGDSLTFTARGVCLICSVAGKTITVGASNTTYLITFNALGRWKRTTQEDAQVQEGATG